MNAPDRTTSLELPERMLRLPSFLFVHLAKQWRRLGSQKSGGQFGTDLRGQHLMILASLEDHGASSQKEISERLGIDASDLVALLDDLEKAGLANRKRDERDRRRYAVMPTPAGTKTLRQRLVDVEQLNREMLAPLTQEERDELHRLLLKIFEGNR
ncbi:MarR family winged helix-turn-helix transcriptional regulator [Kutzneria sp. NPDC052558]|uniref:MarR family winged helix-turn-helix transcriptional regulator n=1 Tax=Kutzneria sp. NPDC052558 TaxID=3364121 RepID=UPI0037CAEA9E